MRKSILVIDRPISCGNCLLGSRLFNSNHVGCRAVKGLRTSHTEMIPNWCPLIDVSEKYETVSMGFEREYNICIEEILGDK